jgi:hypothetical protein
LAWKALGFILADASCVSMTKFCCPHPRFGDLTTGRIGAETNIKTWGQNRPN